MSALNENAITRVATVTGVDLETTSAKTDLYTVPFGKVFYPTMVVVRDLSASLAGGAGSDNDFGTGAAADTWRQAIDLSSMTTADTDFMVIRSADVTKYEECSAGDIFGIYVNTGAAAALTATIDVFGYLTDS